ncbi:hypothetical protein NE237_023179 [Protea cynaroides]|uniref:Uncharacterized protein n=1 Tax=Protea cynaroides TaxID=273540 RepID=A0A9Q0HCG3_9MAGN|nr:hypothetical protein NE237_023179 [Protea cynaroides]
MLMVVLSRVLLFFPKSDANISTASQVMFLHKDTSSLPMTGSTGLIPETERDEVVTFVSPPIHKLFLGTLLKKYTKYTDMAQALGLEFLPIGGPKRFSYAEIKLATNNFSNVIGHGGFDMVYKGELSDNRILAVKKRVIDAMHQFDDADKIDDAKKVRMSKRALEKALNRVEAANKGKLAVEDLSGNGDQSKRAMREEGGERRKRSVRNEEQSLQ